MAAPARDKMNAPDHISQDHGSEMSRGSGLPPWIKVRLPGEGAYASVSEAVMKGGLHTVCESARCPNRHECFSRGTATVMILGNTCTRDCSFCAVGNGKPSPIDPDEPHRVAMAAKELKLKHVVVTSVTRDDLADGGAGVFAEVIREVRKVLPEATVEVLTPDFGGSEKDVASVLAARPDVFNHNLETVRRLQRNIRPEADYDRSLGVLKIAAAVEPGIAVKSGLMVGLGETDEEVHETMQDICAAGCNYLTVGQYLAPSGDHMPVDRYVEPDMFSRYEEDALSMGFSGVAASPLIRSSYRAGEMIAGTGANTRHGKV